MLSFATPQEDSQYDYTSISHSFTRFFFNPERFVTFLNTTQTGFAHTSFGTDLEVLGKHIMTMFCIFIVEVSLFCYLRPIFKSIYQPRFSDFHNGAKMENSPPGFLDWVLPTWEMPIHCYSDMGLDTYFFLRFINLLLFFFSSCGILNMFILIPVNLKGSSDEYQASGLDRLSISNISVEKIGRLNFHFVCSLVTILVFNVLVYYELQTVVQIRQTYLNSKKHRNQLSSSILLLGNIKENMRSPISLKEAFDIFPGGVKRVWMTDDFHEYWWQWRQAKEAIDILEAMILRHKDSQVVGYDELSKFKFYPPIYFPLKLIPFCERVVSIRLPGIVRVCCLQKPRPLLKWCVEILREASINISERTQDIVNNRHEKSDKAFLCFEKPESAYIAHQTLLSLEFGVMDQSDVEVNPADVIWPNLARANNILTLFEKHIISIILVVMICFYVVPVSMIGLISQPYLITHLVPFLTFLNKLPEEIKIAISNLLPTILLNLMAAVQLRIFRKLLYLKGSWTWARIESELLQWYFAFLFIQQFIVVSILSSLAVIVVQVIEKPASIPVLLGANIPKSANFFFKFLAVKAFTVCGNGFLRIEELIQRGIVFLLVDKSPRMKLKRATKLRQVRWGSHYSAIAIYGAIGVTYCVISPVISVFMVLLLGLILLYYKYALRNVYSRLNPSETFGNLYFKALFQILSGVYCLEFSMIGILFSLRKGAACPMKFQALIVIIVLVLTSFGHVLLYSRFVKHFHYLPQISDVEPGGDAENKADEQEDLNNDFTYLHPCYKYEKPVLWLPGIQNGHCQQSISDMLAFDDAIGGVLTASTLDIENCSIHTS